MASDLIPPPSPAGRPSGDAEAERERARERHEANRRHGSLWSRSSQSSDPVTETVEEIDAAEAPPEERTESPYRSRFGLVLGALIGVGIATLAIGAAVYVGTSSGNGTPEGWSSWKPDTDNGVAAAEIATHVGRKYRLSDGNQIVGVQGSKLAVFDVPLEVALRTAPQGGDINFINGGKGLMYTLNGLGPKGSVRGGKPSEARHLLLRREALELALYTFRYVKNVNLVVALLPPKPPAKTKNKDGTTTTSTADTQTQALFYRPGDLEPQLEIPLNATIPAKTPRPETIPPAESRRIDALTRGNLFLASFQQGQDQKAFLVLDRLPG